jgi:hypothetical protein
VTILAPLRLLGFLLAGVVETAFSQQTEAGFVSPDCHVAFSHPADWEVVRDTLDPGDACRFTLRPLDWPQRLAAQDSIDVDTIWLHIAPRGVWHYGPESPFERTDSGWVVLGRHGIEQPADTVSGPGWTGLRGTAVQGCYRLEGGYAGICGQFTALVGTGGQSVLLIGGPRTEDTFNHILATLRFHP